MSTGQGTASPAPRNASARARALLLAAVALLPWLYALGNELFLTKLHGAEGGDLAVLELGIFDAWNGERLLGPYSRFGWHHPGPIYFYLLLPIYALTNASSAALFITSSLLGCAALAGLLWTAWRSVRDARRSWLLLLPITLLALVPVLFGVGLRPWNPVVVVLPFGLLLLVSARLAAGRTSVLPWAIALHAFVCQTHVGTAVAATLIVASASLLGAFDRERPAWRTLRIPLGLAAAVALIAWLPVVVDQVWGERNLDALAQFARKSQGTLGPARGLRFAARQLAGFFTGPLGLSEVRWKKVLELSAGLGLCLLLPFSLRRARALGERVLERLIVLTGIALIAAAISASRIVGEAHNYLAYFMYALGAVGWGGVLAVWAQPGPARLPATLLLGAAASALLVRVLPAAHTSPSTLRPIADAHAALMESMAADVAAVRVWKCSPVLTTGWYAGEDDWGLLAKLLVQLTRREQPVTLQTRHRFMFGRRFRYANAGECELSFSRVRDRSLPVFSRHGAVVTQVSPPDPRSRAAPDMRGVTVVAARGIDGNPSLLVQAVEANRAAPALRFAPGQSSSVELELPGATLRSAWLVGEAQSDYVLESSVDRVNWDPLGQFSSNGDLLREPGAGQTAQAWVRLRKPRGSAGGLSSLNFEFGDWRFVMLGASGTPGAERIVDGVVPPFEAALNDERIVGLGSGTRIRLLAPNAGVLRGLSLVADLRGAYRFAASTDGWTFRDLGEIHAAALPGLGRHLFFFDEAFSVLELLAIPESGPHAVAEVTPLVWEGVDLAVGALRGRRYLLEGWSKDAADQYSAYVWLLGRAGLKLPERPRADHTLVFWLAVHDEPGEKPVMTVAVAGTRIAAQKLGAGEQTVRVTIPAQLMAPSVRVELDLEYPARGGAAAEDGEREPSVAVRRIVLSPVEPYVRSASAATVF